MKKELTEKELIHYALNDLSEALAKGFELKSPEGKAFAFMIDSAIKYGQVIKRNDCPLHATADYTTYEQEVFLRENKNITLVK